MKKSILYLLIFLLPAQLTYGQKVLKYYLAATKPVTNADGSINRPFSSFGQVQSAIKKNKAGNIHVKVLMRNGTYTLPEPLTIHADIFTDTLSSLEFASYPGEKVTISGGVRLPSKWVRADGNIWKLKVPSEIEKIGMIRSLFKNDKRLLRASSDTLFTQGPMPQYAGLYKVYDFKTIDRLRKDSIQVFCGLTYQKNTLDHFTDTKHAELILYNSWEASWHSILQVDPKNHVLYLKNPATYPVGFFSNRCRYRIENVRQYLDQPGEWLYDPDAKELSYFAGKGENPNNSGFVVPVLDKLVVIKGDERKKQYVRNISFSNITFSYSTVAWGINKVPEDYKKENPGKYAGLDFNQGFSSVQASLDCGQAVYLEWADHCSFTRCTFKHLGNYALRIGRYSRFNTLSQSDFFDIGGGGIIIGFDAPGGKRNNWPAAISPSYNMVKRCTLSDCGVFFPSGVGIGIMQANHTTIVNNHLYDLPYTGISVGWSYGYGETYTTDNLIADNYIHDVMKVLTDGGGIYTLGRQTGSRYRNNYIENVVRSKNAIGSNNNGFFFDQGSSDFSVDSNMVINVQNQDIRFNQTDSSRIRLGTNYFQKSADLNKNLILQRRKRLPVNNIKSQ